jgi:hypothetical protein
MPCRAGDRAPSEAGGCLRFVSVMNTPANHRDRDPLRWAAMMGFVVLAAGGCAGGTWLDRTVEAELPVGPPANNYPTAIRSIEPGMPAAEAAPMQALPAPSAASPSAATQGASAEPAGPQTATPPPAPHRVERPEPIVTSLAVVPPIYAPQPAKVAPPATPANLPSAPQAAPAPDAAAAAMATPEAIAAAMTPAGAWPISMLQPASRMATVVAPRMVDPAAIAGAAALPVAPAEPSLGSAAASANRPSPASATLADRRAEIERLHGELTTALEADIRERRSANADDEELPRLEQQLRLAYLVAGRLDDAASAVESLDAAQQESYKHLMFGLGIWLSPDEARRPPLRSAKVLRSLREATAELAVASKLEIRKLAFCESIQNFGWYTEFPRNEFRPKQQVILYAEVENFSAEHRLPAGYETELHGSYEIFDSQGQIVAARQLQPDKELCHNYRRDYFLGYVMYMPAEIAPGHYRLELTIEDMKARGQYQGRKLGEGMIEFTIR